MSWPLVKLGTLVAIKTGRLDANAADDEGIYPFFTCSRAPLRINTHAFDCDAILIAGNGDLNVKHYSGKFNAYQRTYVVTSLSDKILDTRYLFYFMDKYVERLRELSIGGVIKYIKLGMLTDAEIPLPPLPEQKRIAAILDKADAIRRKRQQAIQLADDFLRAVFLDMFGDPVTNPKGWEEHVLKEIADIRSGVTKGKAVKPEDSVTRPYMRVANVQDGYLDLADVQQITVSKRDAEKCLLLEGDILLTEGGDPDKLGRGHVWRSEVEGCLHQNHIFSVRVNDRECVRPAFLSAIISSPRGKRYFLKVGKQTTGIATINKSVLSEFVPFVPPVVLQDKYLAVAKRVDAVKQSLAEGDFELFNSLSHKAFAAQL